MPQFDFYIWLTLSLASMVAFQFFYYYTLYFLVSPLANFQKTFIKIYDRIRHEGDYTLFHMITGDYFKTLKRIKASQEPVESELAAPEVLAVTPKKIVKKKSRYVGNTIKDLLFNVVERVKPAHVIYFSRPILFLAAFGKKIGFEKKFKFKYKKKKITKIKVKKKGNSKRRAKVKLKIKAFKKKNKHRLKPIK